MKEKLFSVINCLLIFMYILFVVFAVIFKSILEKILDYNHKLQKD